MRIAQQSARVSDLVQVERDLNELRNAININANAAEILQDTTLPPPSMDTIGRFYVLTLPQYGSLLVMGIEGGWRVIDSRPHSLQATEDDHLAPPAVGSDIVFVLLAETANDPLIEMPTSPGTVINMRSGPAYEFAFWVYCEWSGNNNSATFELFDGGVATGRTIVLEQVSNQANFNQESTVGLIPEDPGLAGTVHPYSIRLVAGDPPTLLRANATVTAIGWPDFS